VLPRPRHSPAFGLVRLAMTALLATHVFISAWLVATAEGVYTEGKPAPTEAHSLIAIDKDQTAVDIEIKRATSFFFYTLQRDGDASVPVGNTTDETPDASSGDEQEKEPETTTQREWLELGRQTVTVSLVFLVLSEVLMMVSFRWRHYVRALAFTFTLVSFSVLFPACYIMELAGEGTEGEDDSTATNTPGANIETVSFVHTNTSSDFHVIWLGIQLEADFSGYDLGLVEPENRTQVWQEVPDEGSQDAKSFIAFESTFDIQLGKNLDSLLVLPLMWFFLPASPQALTATEEKEEE